MNDRTIADNLILRRRMAETAARMGWDVDPDGEAAVGRRIRRWFGVSLLVWCDIFLWIFRQPLVLHLEVPLIAASVWALLHCIGLAKLRMRRSHLYHVYAYDILSLLDGREGPALPEWEMRINLAILETLIPGMEDGRLTEEHAAKVVALMSDANIRTARILAAHLRMMLEAEGLRNGRLTPVVRRTRQAQSGAAKDGGDDGREAARLAAAA